VGRRVELEGTLVWRDGRTMVELAAGSLRPLEAEPGPSPPLESLGRRVLRGEIVDSKCFLGVMNPGNLKPHRACATLCIQGGIPPVLCVRDGEGVAAYLLLVDADGGAVHREVLPFVARPVEITGEVSRVGDQLVLYADPETYVRL